MEPLTHQPSAHLSVIICAHLIDQLEGKEREFVWKGRVGSGQQVIDPSLESIHHVPHRTDATATATASAKDNVQHSLQLTTVYYYTSLEPSSSSCFPFHNPSINKNTTVTLLFAFSFCAGQTLFSLSIFLILILPILLLLPFSTTTVIREGIEEARRRRRRTDGRTDGRVDQIASVRANSMYQEEEEGGGALTKAK